MQPRKGMYFEHVHWLDSSLPVEEAVKAQHMVCLITKIARGTVYYRPVYKGLDALYYGKPMCCPIDQFDRWAKRELNTPVVGGETLSSFVARILDNERRQEEKVPER